MLTMKRRNVSILLMTMVLLSITLGACGPREPKIDINMEKTGFAQTAEVQATMTAQAQPTATNTLAPTATQTPTRENTPTESVTITATQSGPQAATPTSGTVSGIDKASWLANDPPDNTKVEQGQKFTVTWTIDNKGTSTWTGSYYIQFASGEQMGAVEKVFLPYPVQPNRNVKISVDFVAPQETGVKRSDWKFFNANGTAFYDFYIIMEVVPVGELQTSEPTATLTTVAFTPTVTATPTETIEPTEDTTTP